jgi:hypothetical protein
VPTTDAQNLEQRHWMLHPVCLYLHLPAELKNAACLVTRGLRDQNLTARQKGAFIRDSVNDAIGQSVPSPNGWVCGEGGFGSVALGASGTGGIFVHW